ncbi:MAG: LysR family transcriptional regulator ArgP [Rhodobacteraceae bacterium]|nr:LysR family transcriptional regulator ArgP [Paracoccaceae bacterium]
MTFDYIRLQTLAAILRTGSFDAAAADLGITQSAVSQRLKALEEQVGARLVLREHPCLGTDAGRRLAAHFDHVGLLEADLISALGTESKSSAARLRLAVNADSLATWFPAALASIPGVFFDIVVDDQDFSADWLRKGEVTAAVTAEARAAPGCDCHPLGILRYVATASPAFMARHFPHGVTPEALARAPMLRFNEKDALQDTWLTRNAGLDRLPPFHRLPSSEAFAEACRLGIAWGMAPEQQIRDDLDAERLVPLLPRAELDVPLYWQISRLLAKPLQDMTRAIRQAARTTLLPFGRDA